MKIKLLLVMLLAVANCFSAEITVTNFVTVYRTNWITRTNYFPIYRTNWIKMGEAQRPVEKPESKIKLLGAGVVAGGEGLRKITGRFQNQSDKSWRRVRIIFNLINSRGLDGDQAVVLTLNVKPWQVIDFQSEKFSNEYRTFRDPLIEGELAD